MPREKRKKLKNRYARSSKLSEYKTLQLVECFARDLSVRDSARITKMTERTVRDRFSEIRSKLLSWAVDYPDYFNGFGHLLLDPEGTININLLELMVYYSESESFKKRMANRYPRFQTEKDPALHHVIEIIVKRFTSLELPEVNPDFQAFVQKAFSASRVEAYFRSLRHKPPAHKLRLTYWKAANSRINSQREYHVRRFPHADGESLFRDLKHCLRRDPI